VDGGIAARSEETANLVSIRYPPRQIDTDSGRHHHKPKEYIRAFFSPKSPRSEATAVTPITPIYEEPAGAHDVCMGLRSCDSDSGELVTSAGYARKIRTYDGPGSAPDTIQQWSIAKIVLR
jgi:hypothetical protein